MPKTSIPFEYDMAFCEIRELIPEAGLRQPRGFTLIELVVVIVILGVIAALAVPRFIDMSTNARTASLNTLAATLNSTAINVRAMCKTNPACDYTNPGQSNVLIGDRVAWVNFGWLDAGDTLGDRQIDAWVNYSGFTASIPNLTTTKFSLDGAPDPANCAVSYTNAYTGSPISIATVISGC